MAFVLMTLAFKPVQLMAESTAEPTKLRCEFSENPSGIAVPTPRFSWTFKDSKTRGQRQSAYQILLATSEELLKKDNGDLPHRWNRVIGWNGNIAHRLPTVPH